MERGPPVCLVIIVRQPIAGLSQRALEHFTARARQAAGLHARVNVVLTTSGEVRALNRAFRGKDEPTDVLSFPAIFPEAFAGDIVISCPMARRNAQRLGHAAAQEIKILVLHGLLHLAGYDHENDRGRMARKEARLRRELRLPPTLIERAQPPAAVPHSGKRRGKRW